MGSNAQQFCLKWNNHQANMLSVFDRLLSNKSLVDVTIGCEGRQVKAHKVVLSACSPFFENLFTENPCKHPIVILKDIRYADLKALVEFMYKGEVNVVQEQLPTLLKTAEALKIKGLAEVTGEGKSDDKPHASVTPRPESPGSRRKRQRVRRKSTDSAAGVSESEESVPKAGRTEHDDSSMDGATSLDDGSQASLQHPQTPSQASGQARGEKETSNVQSNAVTVNNSSSSAQANSGNSTTNGPNSSSKDADFEPTRLLEASMTTDHGADNSTDLNNSTGPENPLLPDGLDIKPIITLEEGATPTGGIVPASGATSLATGTDAISSLFPYPQGTGAAALPGTSHQASPQSHGRHMYNRSDSYPPQNNSSVERNSLPVVPPFNDNEMVITLEEFGGSFSEEAWEIGGGPGVGGNPGGVSGPRSAVQVGQEDLLDLDHMPGGEFHQSDDFGCLEPSTVRRRGRTPTKYRLYDRRGSFSFAGRRGTGLFYFQVKVNYARTSGNVTYYCCAEAKRDSRCKAGLRWDKNGITRNKYRHSHPPPRGENEMDGGTLSEEVM